MSSISTVTATDTSQVIQHALRDVDPTDTEPTRLGSDGVAAGDQPNDDYIFLTQNNGVTGREPDLNPTDWLTNHRRVPPYRPPVTHTEWVTVGGPLPMRIFLWNMFSGCQLLQWGYSAARGLGLHERGYCMYKVANEW